MKQILVATALAIFGLVPAMGYACEYNDDSASAATPEQLASTPPAATSKAPARTASQAVASKVAKPTADKAKSLASERKLAAVTSN